MELHVIITQVYPLQKEEPMAVDTPVNLGPSEKPQ